MNPTTVIPFPIPIPEPKQIDGRDEMNFAEFPISVLSNRSPTDQTKLEFHDEIRDTQTGKVIQRRVLIVAPAEYGLPNASDDEIILGLMQLTKLRNNFSDRKVHFSRYELIRLLSWPDIGRSYQRVDEALDRWLAVTLSYEKAWYDNERKSWVDEKFHILDNVSLYERDKSVGKKAKDQGILPFSSFTWNEVVFRSFQAGYLKRLDLDFYLGLQHQTAKRMYRFIDKKFYHRAQVEFDLESFALEHIGLSRSSCVAKSKNGQEYINVGKIREKLTAGIAELEAHGFLKPLDQAERFQQIARGKWKIVFVKNQPAIIAVEAKPPVLETELTKRGITVKTAADLVVKFEAVKIEHQVEVFDWIQEVTPDRLGKNPAGYLVKSIQDDYAPPSGFESRVERERKAKAVEEAKAKLQHQANEKRRQEREEKAARQALRDHVRRYVDSLSAEERQALEEQAVTAGEAWQQDCLRQKGPGHGMIRQMLIEQEVMRVCPME